MKKILVLMMIGSFVLFSCSMDQLTGFMGKMGNNVMGEYVDKDSIDSIKSSTENAKTNDVGSDNKATIGKLKVDAPSGVTKILSGLTDEEMDSYVDNAVSASLNEKSKDEFLKAMSESVNDDIKAAAQGTAKIAEEALDDLLNNIAPGDESIKNALSTLKDSMNDITSKDSVTAGDVIALQMMTSLVESVSDLAAVDADGKISGTIDIKASDADKVASAALNTVKVLSSMSSATSVKLGDLSDIIKSFTDEQDSKALRSGTVVEGKYASAIQQVYRIYTGVFPSGVTDDSIAALSMYKSAIDIYIAFSGSSEISNDVANLSGIAPYLIASAFTAADNAYVNKADAIFSDCPSTLNGLIDEILKANPWIASSDNSLYEWNIPDSIKLNDSDDGMKSFADAVVMDDSMRALAYTLGRIYNTAIGSETDNIGLGKYIDKLKAVTERGIDAWND